MKPAQLHTLPWHEDARKVLDLHRLVLLVGDPGVGKTTFAQLTSQQRTGLLPEVIQGTPSTEEYHIWGHQSLKSGATEFHDGPLPKALKEGRDLIVEEMNLIPHEIRTSMLGLRGADRIRNHHSGEDIDIPPSFRLIATSNPESIRCRRNVQGAQALLDDFMILEVPALQREQMTALLSHEMPSVSDEKIERVLDLWDEYHNLSKEDAIQLSLRAAQHLLRLLEAGMEESKAVEIALVNKYVMDDDAHGAAKMKLDMS